MPDLKTQQAIKQLFSASRPASICTCGHTGDGANSEHLGRSIQDGHGACSKCPCMRFSWASWTLEYAATVG